MMMRTLNVDEDVERVAHGWWWGRWTCWPLDFTQSSSSHRKSVEPQGLILPCARTDQNSVRSWLKQEIMLRNLQHERTGLVQAIIIFYQCYSNKYQEPWLSPSSLSRTQNASLWRTQIFILSFVLKFFFFFPYHFFPFICWMVESQCPLTNRKPAVGVGSIRGHANYPRFIC